MRRLGDPLGHRLGSRGLLGGVLSGGPVRYPRLRSFYVDATGGADGDDGRTPDTAWQTIGKVNGETFLPGDYVLFKRGETWVGTRLLFPSSGSVQRPIVVDAYDAGADPIIDGNDLVDCFEISGKSNIVIRNIEITQGLNFGFYIHASSFNITLLNCTAHDCGNDNIIFIDGVFDCQIISCISFDVYERVAGPRISCLEISDDCHDILIRDFEAYGAEGSGIAIHNHAATEFPYNLTFDNISSHDNDDNGVIIAQDNAAPSLPADVNIQFQNGSFNENAGPGTGADINLVITGDPQPVGIVFDQCVCINAFERPVFVGSRAKFTRCVFHANFQARVDGAENVIFYNCTFYRVGNLAFDIIGATDGVLMRNCIIVTDGNVPIVVTTITNVDIDYMIYDGALDIETNAVMFWNGVAYNWANWKINSGQDANSPIPADPLFVDKANDDFRLQAGSPAINAGVNVGLPFSGSAPDLGAFERE